MTERAAILIVDDDESTRKSLSLIFRKKGCETHTVGTGREALAAAKERPFDVVVLDIKLPDMQGTELIKPLKEINPDCAIIMATGYGTLESSVRALNNGAVGYIMKPLDLDDVLARVENALEKQRLVRENRRLYEELQRELVERRKNEEKVVKAAQEWRTTFDSIAELISIQDKDYKFTRVSKSLADFLGVHPSDLIGKVCYEVIHKTKEPPAFCPHRMVWETKKTEEQEVFEPHQGIFLHMSVSPVLNAEGGVSGTVHVMEDITERKRNEEKLRSSEALLNEVGNMAHVGGWELDAKTKEVTWTRETYRIHEVPEREKISLSKAILFFDEPGRSVLMKAIKTGLVKGESYDLELPFTSATGKHLWTRAIGRAIVLDGKVDKLTGAFQDITETKRTQDALRKSEEKYRRIVETSAEGIWAMDKNFTTTFVNPRMAELLGYREEEMIGKTVDSFMFEEELADHQTKMRERKKGLKAQYERRFRKRDGTALWTSVSASPLMDDKGRFNGSFGMFTDVTEEKQVEDNLRQSEERYRTILHTMEDGYFEVDLEGNFTSFNESMRRMLGYEKEEMIGLNYREYMTKETAQEVFLTFNKSFRTGSPARSVGWKLVKKDKTKIDIETSVSLKRNREDEPVGFFGIARDITERKRAEEALQESEENLAMAQRVAEVGSWDWDLKTGRLLWSSETFSIFGRDPADYTPSVDNARNSVHPDDRDLLERKVRTSIERDESYEHQYRIITPDGVIKHLHALGEIIRDKENRPARLRGAIQDITERKHAEEDLRRSEELFRNLFMYHSAVKLIIEPDTGQIVDANEAAAGYYGWSIEQLKNMKIQEINTLSSEEIKEEMENARTAKRIHFEFRHRKADGSIRDVEVFSSKIEVSGKDLLHSIIHDITDRRRAEEGLLTSEAQLSNALRIARAGHWEYDVETDTFTFNDNFYRIFRTTAEEVGGYRLTSADYALRFCHPDDVAMVSKEIQAALETGDPNYSRQLEHRILYDNGEVGYIAVRFFIVKDSQGRTVKTYGVNQDITEQKRLEQQLLQTEKLSAIGTMISGVAHELNNPLTSIIGIAQLLQKRDIPEDVRVKLDVLIKESVRSSKIVGGLLAFAREHKPERKQVNINDILLESLKLREYDLKVSDIDVQTAFSDDLPETYADPYQLQQVLINLINNARDALIGRQHAALTMRTYRKDDDIIVEVEDNGPGIPKELAIKIFDPFFTTKDVGKGTGLGLSMAYGIIREHEGTISVESGPGCGAKFIVAIPIREGEEGIDIKAKTPVKVPPGTQTVLVVEDEESLRDLLSDALTEAGFLTETASTGSEAINLLKKRAYHVIVSDIKMPGIGGKDLYLYVQKHYPDLTKKIVFITGDVLSKDTQLFLSVTNNRYIEKPFNVDVLSAVVSEVLSE